MTRGANDTARIAPIGRVVDPERTDPGEPPPASTNAEVTEPSAWSPDALPLTPAVRSPDATDPGLDPMLEAFNRTPRPPAPQPNLRASSDGDEFAAHYASPRELRAPQVGPAGNEPAVLVQLARTDTEPMTVSTPGGARIAPRDAQTMIVRGERRIPVRTLLAALAAGTLIAAPAAFFLRGPSNSPTAGASTKTEPTLVQPRGPLPNAESPSNLASSASTPTPVRSAYPIAPPVAEVKTTRRPPSASPRPATSEHVKPPAAPRPAHETPDTVL